MPCAGRRAGRAPATPDEAAGMEAFLRPYPQDIMERLLALGNP